MQIQMLLIYLISDVLFYFSAIPMHKEKWFEFQNDDATYWVNFMIFHLLSLIFSSIDILRGFRWWMTCAFRCVYADAWYWRLRREAMNVIAMLPRYPSARRAGDIEKSIPLRHILQSRYKMPTSGLLYGTRKNAATIILNSSIEYRTYFHFHAFADELSFPATTRLYLAADILAEKALYCRHRPYSHAASRTHGHYYDLRGFITFWKKRSYTTTHHRPIVLLCYYPHIGFERARAFVYAKFGPKKAAMAYFADFWYWHFIPPFWYYA